MQPPIKAVPKKPLAEKPKASNSVPQKAPSPIPPAAAAAPSTDTETDVAKARYSTCGDSLHVLAAWFLLFISFLLALVT